MSSSPGIVRRYCSRAAQANPPCLVEPLKRLDLRAADVSAVVWAEGYDYDFDWIDLPVFNTRGEPVHRQGITEVPAMYFLGLRWLSNFRSSLLSGIGDDAVRIANHVAGRTC